MAQFSADVFTKIHSLKNIEETAKYISSLKELGEPEALVVLLEMMRCGDGNTWTFKLLSIVMEKYNGRRTFLGLLQVASLKRASERAEILSCYDFERPNSS